LVDLAQGNLEEAEKQAQQAGELFRQFPEGLAHVHRVCGILCCKRDKWDDALTELEKAQSHFDDKGEAVEIARTQFQIARVYGADKKYAGPALREALLETLKQAEACRRSKLVRQIDEELKVADPEAYFNHVYQRAWGGSLSVDPISLMTGSLEHGTVLYLDLKGSTEYARDRDPGEVMLALNQMMADLVSRLEKHDARVSGFRGDGFLALLRGADHALRGVRAAFELVGAIKEFNKPRSILKLPLFTVRTGIASGQMSLGNLGTYYKMDFTAIGTTANLGARLEAHAEPGLPCISRETHDLVQAHFIFREGNSRTANLKGLGNQEIWDVVRER
jgi:class 3 adenylate cyclase